MRFALSALAVLFAASAAAQTPITLDQAMADPDWIGTPVDSGWWGWDSHQIYYTQKRLASPLHDTYQIVHGAAQRVADAQLANLDSEHMVYNRDHTRALLLRHGDLFERDLKSGALAQIVRGSVPVTAPQYAADGAHVQFRIGSDWYSWSRAERLVAPVALLRTAKDPDAEPDAEPLRDMQLRLISTLARVKGERDAKRARSDEERRADPTRAPLPVYLGDKVAIDSSALSPDGRYLLVVTSEKDAEAKAHKDKMAKFVTESGFEEAVDQRTRVGHDGPTPHRLLLVDLRDRSVHELSYDALPGIAVDPLAELRAAQKLPPLKGNRPVWVGRDADAVEWTSDDDSIKWTGDGSQVAVSIRAIDNKDRWIATVDLAHAQLRSVYRLSDPAWVNNRSTELGWLPDNRTLWYVSEESGYAHLYTRAPDGRTRALTSGKWEVTQPEWSADASHVYFVCNPKLPGTYEVCDVSVKDGALRELTKLGGVEDFALSPDGRQLLVHYSAAYLPPQLATVPSNGGAATVLTDTRSAAFKARQWIMPQIVPVPSTHGAAPVWAKLYRPATLQPGKQYPIVMFIHGAGYLQNVSQRYPAYFREQMFHNLLVQQGYIVLDMDYRASEGYGRDWRTAIYRQMGHPELEDYIDGAHWLAATQQGDLHNVGVYGGSYGGFMTFMALLRAPELFKSGAALRPVTDWTSYNHEYTSNILNTPELDPEAYRTSSPIEYAANLRGNLLIAHGMVDDNVFYQDSVRMEQRLIELKKANWEMASYPLERHGFAQPESWYDEYRRIDELFERTLK